MNSADFSLSTYNMDNSTGDFSLSDFDMELAPDSAYVVPFALAAYARSGGALKLFFSPWSPPGWMKESGSMIDNIWPIGLKADPNIHSAWALYFVKFVQALRSKGLPMWGLTIQNEPLSESFREIFTLLFVLFFLCSPCLLSTVFWSSYNAL